MTDPVTIVVFLLSLTAVIWAILNPVVKNNLLKLESDEKEIKANEGLVHRVFTDSNGEPSIQKKKFGKEFKGASDFFNRAYVLIWWPAALNVVGVLFHIEWKFWFSADVLSERFCYIYMIMFLVYNAIVGMLIFLRKNRYLNRYEDYLNTLKALISNGQSSPDSFTDLVPF